MATLPPDVPLVVAGRSADGHADALAELVAHADRPVRVTGHLSERDFAAVLAGPTVPVAPNRGVTGSATIAAWWGAGRRPLVPDVPATQAFPASSVTTYTSLPEVLAQVWAEPDRTRLPTGVRPGPDLMEVAMLRRAALLDWQE